jgi:hypothetical protein
MLHGVFLVIGKNGWLADHRRSAGFEQHGIVGKEIRERLRIARERGVNVLLMKFLDGLTIGVQNSYCEGRSPSDTSPNSESCHDR